MTNNGDTLTAERLLDEAEKKINEGNLQESCVLVWQAAMSALSALAQQHGLPCSTRDEAWLVAHHLDALTDPMSGTIEQFQTPNIPEQRTRNYAFFRMADMYREQLEKPDESDERRYEYVEGYWWEPREYPLCLDIVRGHLKALGKINYGDKRP